MVNGDNVVVLAMFRIVRLMGFERRSYIISFNISAEIEKAREGIACN